MKKYLIKEYRKEFNYTQAQLAELVGCDQPMIARWENIEEDSDKTISNENIIKLAKIFNVTADVFCQINNLFDSCLSGRSILFLAMRFFPCFCSWVFIMPLRHCWRRLSAYCLTF